MVKPIGPPEDCKFCNSRNSVIEGRCHLCREPVDKDEDWSNSVKGFVLIVGTLFIMVICAFMTISNVKSMKSTPIIIDIDDVIVKRVGKEIVLVRNDGSHMYSLFLRDRNGLLFEMKAESITVDEDDPGWHIDIHNRPLLEK